MTHTTPFRRRLAISVPVVWPTLSLAGWGLAHVLGGPENLVDSAVKVGMLMLAVAAVDRTRRWRHRRRAR
ncbi:hypothetical protein OIE69_35020 [Actinacidiphila glaucinigra]|uniref:hypothetical protein n=1 Tax=Actinacidiphila glaucinigra TaxID=235986 RepID=UPI002DD9C4EC|nr:hypothetical protein [Actinacidiphila glaucinigra]WSD63736.1 hypothetical protein OIE69_35020 [Actinacidiphila glaucinigra]